MGQIKDLTNAKFERLRVVELDGIKNNRAMWKCKCECGNVVVVSSNSLLSKKTKSCGCLNKQKILERNTKHGLCKTKLYKTWCGMKQRCYNKNDFRYKLYGGRGIKICDEWKDSFINFYNWSIKNGFEEHFDKYGSKDTSIDRIDVNGNYEPSNCRWATRLEQANNRR